MNPNSRSIRSWLLIMVLACAVGSAWAQDDRLTETNRQVYPITNDGVFSVKDVNGSVTVKAWDMPTVEVNYTKRGPSKEKMDMVRVEINATAQRIDVNTIYPRGERNLNVDVSYDINIPRTVRLRDISTVNGAVQIDGMTVEVNASTVNGSVKVLNSSGRVSAETTNGSITAELNQIDPSADMKFETVNGSIKVYIPDRAGAEVAAETVNGGIQTDFPITVQGKFGPKSLRGTVGAGGARIHMETVNGSVHLYRR